MAQNQSQNTGLSSDNLTRIAESKKSVSPEEKEYQENLANSLQQAQILARRFMGGDLGETRDKEKDLEAAKNVGKSLESTVQSALAAKQNKARFLSKSKTLQAIKAGSKLGGHLRKKLAEGSLKGYIFALGLGLVKDFSDILQIGTLTNIVVTVALWRILLMQGNYIRRWLLKRAIGKIFAVVLIEFIPVFNVIPWYTISIFILKRTLDKRRSKMQDQLRKLTEQEKNASTESVISREAIRRNLLSNIPNKAKAQTKAA